MYPDPNFLDAAGRNWTALVGRVDDTNEKNFRIDHNFSDMHRVMWRYTPEFRLNDFATSSGFPFLRQANRTPARNMTGNCNATFRPNLIMDLTLVRSHNRITQFPPDLSGATWGINIPQLFPSRSTSGSDGPTSRRPTNRTTASASSSPPSTTRPRPSPSTPPARCSAAPATASTDSSSRSPSGARRRRTSPRASASPMTFSATAKRPSAADTACSTAARLSQWNLNIQHGLSNNTVIEIGYAGSRTLHMMRTVDVNQPFPDPLIAQGQRNANAARQYKGWSTINHREQSYAANYHGLQLGLNRSYAHGLLFQTAYTWSKTIDNADFTGGIYGFAPNSQDLSGQRGRASLDATHNFIGSAVWDIPFLKDGATLASKVVGGWQASTVYTLRTGMPIQPLLGRDNAGVGTASGQRPDVNGNPTVDHGERTIARWFDSSVFSAPALGTFSSLGRNTISGPGWNQWDISFVKKVPFGEGRQLELRADGFNFFNHTQWNGVGTTLNQPATFGRITSTRNERSFMVGARIQF
ncbi:MAG: hypothetical protein R2729_23605 [Bryobacteraceae bacterium]